jgi:MFS family permease
MTLAADLSPEGYRGLFLGFWNTVGDMGSAIGPVLMGLVSDYYGLMVAFYVIAALMFVNAGTTHFFVKETITKAARAQPNNAKKQLLFSL